jgi:hypothetical protein
MHTKTLLLSIFWLITVPRCFAQSLDSTAKISHLSGSASVTNNGISLVPTFSLEKPATIFDMSLSKGNFSFDPELAFSMDGHPWYFLLWLRYKIASAGKFKLTAGTHLGLNFKKSILPVDSASNKPSIVERYVVGELAPTYSVSKNISAGFYYLFSHGLDAGTANAIHFITVNVNFSHIKLNEKFYMKLIPQCYYLKIHDDDGFYFTASLTLARYNFPLTISSLINQAIKTGIDAGNGFTWNISLSYAFAKK